SARGREDPRRRVGGLAELDGAKTAFFSNVSHELRTPLTLMLAPLEDALARAGLPEAERERLELVHRKRARACPSRSARASSWCTGTRSACSSSSTRCSTSRASRRAAPRGRSARPT